MDFKSKIILISGPTASGKSIFAINLAKKINGGIINTYKTNAKLGMNFLFEIHSLFIPLIK